jgi:hypothetical protein
MRETRSRTSMTASSFSGSGPPTQAVFPGSEADRRGGAPCTGMIFFHSAMISSFLEKSGDRRDPSGCLVFGGPRYAADIGRLPTMTGWISVLVSSSYAHVSPAGPAPMMIAVFLAILYLPVSNICYLLRS